jgi:hypothetical protein
MMTVGFMRWSGSDKLIKMGQPNERAKRRGPSSLTTAVLAAVVEQSSHGYEISNG